jgi:ferrochelatase
MPAPARALLLNAVILPFRPRRSAEQYRSIWSDRGSPLLVHTRDLAAGLQGELGGDYRVTYAMRYKSPPIAGALDELAEAGCRRVVVVPLFPQYASAAYGSALARTLELASRRWNVPAIVALSPFHDEPGFVRASAEVARGAIADFEADHILFSYHGLPEQQIHKSDHSGEWCLGSASCCDDLGARNSFCYRAQCYATTRALAGALGLEEGTHTTSFQSRLAGQKWIEPYTDQVLAGLRDRGVRRLAVMTPSFVADCLETLEEIGIRLRRQWDGLGGEDLLLVGCLNATPVWTAALAGMVRGVAWSAV